MKRLNLGSGAGTIPGCDTVDLDKSFNPTYSFDLREFPWPIEDELYDEVYIFHTIEHVEKRYHRDLLKECARILKPDGLFIISFPEFEIICRYWLENEGGIRDYWEATIYGLQRTNSDYHLCACSTEEMLQVMLTVGFTGIKIKKEHKDQFNTVMMAKRAPVITVNTYEKVLYDEVIVS